MRDGLYRLAEACRSRRINTLIRPYAGVRNTIGRFDPRGCFRRLNANWSR